MFKEIITSGAMLVTLNLPKEFKPEESNPDLPEKIEQPFIIPTGVNIYNLMKHQLSYFKTESSLIAQVFNVPTRFDSKLSDSIRNCV